MFESFVKLQFEEGNSWFLVQSAASAFLLNSGAGETAFNQMVAIISDQLFQAHQKFNGAFSFLKPTSFNTLFANKNSSKSIEIVDKQKMN